MLLATKQHTAGNKTRYGVDYCEWLEVGRTLDQSAGFTATVNAPAPADITLSGVSVTATRLYFFVAGGSLNEAFTVETKVTDTLGEVVVDTIQFTVVQP